MTAAPASISWARLVRLGLVQLAIGAVFVLVVTTFNRVMVVELRYAAVVPSALIALQFLVQLVRPRLGFGSDRAGRRTPWILGGVAMLATGAVAAAAALGVMVTSRSAGLALAVAAYVVVGLGVSAAGTPFLALIAERVPADRRAGAAALSWSLMIAGFVLATVGARVALAAFSYHRLVLLTAIVGGIAVALAIVALHGIDDAAPDSAPMTGRDIAARPARAPFREAIAEVWADAAARRLTIFIFLAMLAFSAEDLIVEPFAALVFGLAPGASAGVSAGQNGGMLAGMIAAALLARRGGSLRTWAAGGCAASALAFLALAASPLTGQLVVAKIAAAALGASNGVFAVGAIGTMMALAAGQGGTASGVRMGVFGAAQALAYGVGGLVFASASDLARHALGSASAGYGLVFVAEALLFALAAAFAARSATPGARPMTLAGATA
jgi:BCD family chlorophyll transporter-like MFS transporter